MRRLGVFGGTFDPIHNGHIAVAGAAAAALGLDEVLFIPAGRPRLRESDVVAAPHHRLRMVELATAGEPLFTSSDIEIGRSGPTYTADTLEQLEGERGGCWLYLIAGMDALAKFDRWGRPQAIMERAIIVGVPRPGHERLDPAPFERVAPGSSARAVALEGPMLDISSTEIRARARRGQPIDHLVPRDVARYISDNRLYRRTETC